MRLCSVPTYLPREPGHVLCITGLWGNPMRDLALTGSLDQNYNERSQSHGEHERGRGW
jgi:hypothetical protein